jgi:transcriptional regulator with XRE-family HTH domain
MSEESKPTFGDMLKQARGSLAYKKEGVVLDFTEAMAVLMQKQGVHQCLLASRLGVTPAYISQVMSGEDNFTVETLVKLADALQADVKIELVSRTESR